jgi:hypothetical protein
MCHSIYIYFELVNQEYFLEQCCTYCSHIRIKKPKDFFKLRNLLIISTPEWDLNPNGHCYSQNFELRLYEDISNQNACPIIENLPYH